MQLIRLSCQKQGITSLCAAADFPLDDSEKNCLERMAGQLKQLGIDMHTAENASADTAAWDSLAETGNVNFPYILYVHRCAPFPFHAAVRLSSQVPVFYPHLFLYKRRCASHGYTVFQVKTHCVINHPVCCHGPKRRY